VERKDLEFHGLVCGPECQANFHSRIEIVMIYRRAGKLNFQKKLLVTVTGMLVVSPLIIHLAKAQISPRPAFEVASLKRTPDGGPPVFISLIPRRTGGRLIWSAPLSEYLIYAYHLPRWRISGINTIMPEFYTVEATMDPSTSEDQVRLMLQALLIDRFKIASHWETRSCSGYRLIAERNGSRLKTATAAGEAPPMPEYRKNSSPGAFEGRIITEGWSPGTLGIMGRGVSMSQLSDQLSKELGECVVDRTNLTGKYYFGFQFGSVSHPSDDADSPSIFSALKDQLGLKLEKQKGTTDVLVIDHYERTPSEN
jgi:uncharacterized protein (TIGR03435 family)